MLKAKKKRQRRAVSKKTLVPTFIAGLMLFLPVAGLGAWHLVTAAAANEVVETKITVDPNFGVKNKVIEFFIANEAEDMIPIIKCESRFRHYEQDGSVLENKAGSSATGVTQILASAHPDPKIIYRYNKRYDMDLTVDDFDIETIEGNLGYALVLYKVNGVKDWECSKRFRF